MKSRHVLILLVILAAAVGAFLFVEDQTEQQARQELAQSRLIDLRDPVGVQEVEVSGKDLSGPISIKRHGDQHRWDILQPVKAKADYLSVERLINTLVEAKSEKRLSGKQDLASYGLDPAQFTITLKTKDGKVYTVLVGEDSPTGQYLYLAPGDKSQVWLAKKDIRPGLTQSLFDYRDKSALDFVASQVQRLEITYPGQTKPLELIRTQKEPKEVWELNGDRKADPEAVTDLLFQISGLRVEEFQDGKSPSEKMGLVPPRARYQLALENGTQLGLATGGPTADPTKVYAVDESGGPVLVLAKSSLDRLARQPKDLILRAVFAFDRDRVTGLTVRRPGETLVYAKRDGRWKRTQPEGDAKSGESAELLAWDLANLKWEELLPSGGAYGLDKPRIELILTVEQPSAEGGEKGSTESYKLLVGEKDNKSGLIAARVEGRDQVFGLKEDFIKGIPGSPKEDKSASQSPKKE